MALLTWSKEYSVGVHTLDNQHTVLFNMLNDLHTAMMKGQMQGVTSPLLRKLAQYTHEHFMAEEAMMAAANFPGLARHRNQHRDLTKQVEDFVAKFERGESAINIQLLSFLRDWLTNHILGSDKEYGPWINKTQAH